MKIYMTTNKCLRCYFLCYQKNKQSFNTNAGFSLVIIFEATVFTYKKVWGTPYAYIPHTPHIKSNYAPVALSQIIKILRCLIHIMKTIIYTVFKNELLCD